MNLGKEGYSCSTRLLVFVKEGLFFEGSVVSSMECSEIEDSEGIKRDSMVKYE